ncbi:MAG: hypothetical protein JRC99_08110, partial [Deltaproteobacteria bacterium]|nr:hypothetical protein [Deltaproteobacteria bacterium]
VRTKIGQFDIESAVRDDAFDGIAGMESPGLGMAEALGHLRTVELDEQQEILKGELKEAEREHQMLRKMLDGRKESGSFKKKFEKFSSFK